VDFRNGDIDGLEVTLTSASASVTGTVTENGRPATDYGVLVFADDETKWRFPSRFMATATPNQQGGFRIAGLPAGAYRAIAVPASEISAAQDPEVLRTLVARATAVFLNDGSTQSVTLTLVRR